MPGISDNSPVLIGCGELVDRDADIDRHIEPLAMLTQVATAAAEDAQAATSLLERLDTVALVDIAGWKPDNPVDLLAGRFNARPARQYLSATGGQAGIELFNLVAGDIVAGRSELALVAGCNNFRVLGRAAAAGKPLNWATGGRGSPSLIGENTDGSNALEADYGLDWPSMIYPLFENALRARLGLDLDTHRRRMGDLFSKFTEVAERNPYAWFPVRRSSDELTTATPQNRMIAFPYTKYLNAVLQTEQAAALLVCSAAKARALGVPEDRWIYWWGGAASREEAWWVSERPDFAQCPAMKDTLTSALRNAATDVEQIKHFDFYSCFPIAVEMACEMLGLPVDDPRGFTVTGGLPYAGGPASAYTLHSVSQMATRLRDNPGDTGLVTGNGWYLTKHSAAVLASAPPQELPPEPGLSTPLPSAEMETEPQAVDTEARGPAEVEAYTVIYDREGQPARGIVLGKTAQGGRFLANTPGDPAFLEAFVSEEQVGRSGYLEQRDGRQIFTI